jgi:uncharacterized Fe-S center protein
MSIVYFTSEITPERLIDLYEALGVSLNGKVAVKISSGEPGGHNYLKPALIGPLVKKLGGTIVECNTAYKGKRSTTADHWQAIRDHGFPAIAPCDIMDEFGEIAIPVTGGKHLTENFVGSHLQKLRLHADAVPLQRPPYGGFGGALKNMSIGVASAHGKAVIHGAGDRRSSGRQIMIRFSSRWRKRINRSWNTWAAKTSFTSALQTACPWIATAIPTARTGDGGYRMFASLDPVALDQACVDAVYASPDAGKRRKSSAWNRATASTS